MKKRPLICYMAISSQLGGAERSLLSLMREIQLELAAEFEIVLVCSHPGPLTEEATRLKIHCVFEKIPERLLRASRSSFFWWIDLSLGFFQGLFYVVKLNRKVLSLQPQIIHVNGLKCQFFSLFGLIQKYHVIWHIRDWVPAGFLSRILKRLGSKNRVRVIANSAATLQQWNPLEPNGTVIYNGFQIPESLPLDRSSVSEVPVIGMMGNLAVWKGQLEFVEMARQMIDEGFQGKFEIAGSQIYETDADQGFLKLLKLNIKKSKLDTRIRLLGQVSNPIDVIQTWDVSVHASNRPEPFGRVIVESMLAGVPITASAAGGVGEILDHEKNGLMHPPGSVQKMKKNVFRLLDDSVLRTRLVKQAFEDASRRFSVSSHAREMANEYRKLLART